MSGLPPISFSSSITPLSRLRHRRGFTLIEVLLTLFIVLVLFGAAGIFSWEQTKTHPLKKFAQELEQFSRTTRQEAMITGKPIRIELTRSGFAYKSSPSEETENELKLPPHTSLEIMLWPKTEWEKPDGQAWVFQPNGLCLPLSIQLKQHTSWFSAAVDCLTGALQDQTYALQ